MTAGSGKGMKLGINGLGRIGKLAVWHHIGRKYFEVIVINIAREEGTSLADIAHYVERESTYGFFHGFLYGSQSAPLIDSRYESNRTVTIDGIPVWFLRAHRNPDELNWNPYGFKLEVNTIGQFQDPTLPPDHLKVKLVVETTLRGKKEALS